MSFPGMSAKEVFNGSLDVVDEYVAKGEIPVIMAWSIIRQAALNSGAPAEQTGNSRYATALDVVQQYVKEVANSESSKFVDWLYQRLNPAERDSA
jgi:hypothetical protein